MKAAIIGIAGTELAVAEADMLRAHAPAGVILFARNVADPVQLASLTTALRDVLPVRAVLMVDQEGGRVARLRPPHWRAHPPAAAIGALYAADPDRARRAAWLTGALIGLDCAEMGVDTVCAPVLDQRWPGAHDVIGDRSFGSDPGVVATLGRAMAEGLRAAGIQPVGKHAPGHGRALADSHLELPRVDAADISADLAPFAANVDLPWMMTAHILFPRLDPDRPATLSPGIIGEIMRGKGEGGIGFDGLLVSDDLAMRALSGEPADLARQTLSAGCDIALYCPGEIAPTLALLESCPQMSGAAMVRLERAWALAATRRIALDGAALAADREALIS